MKPAITPNGLAGDATLVIGINPVWAYHEGWDPIETLSRFSTHANVTSNLDLRFQRVDHCQGEGGMRESRRNGSNSFVIKILISKPLGLKILQTIFANRYEYS